MHFRVCWITFFRHTIYSNILPILHFTFFYNVKPILKFVKELEALYFHNKCYLDLYFFFFAVSIDKPSQSLPSKALIFALNSNCNQKVHFPY